MSFFSSKKKPKEQIDLLFDIGSISVGVAIVKRASNKHPEIIYTAREHIPFQTALNTKRFAQLIMKSLEKASERVFSEGLEHLYFTRFGHRKIKSVYCNFFAPWYASRAKILKIVKDEPFELDKEYIDRLVNQEDRDFTDKILKAGQFRETGPHLEIMENSVLTVKLNGYETSYPFNKKIKEAEISMFMSVAPKEVLNQIRDILSRHWSSKKIYFHTFAIIAFSAIRNMYPNQSDFLFIDIGGEVSDLLLVKDGILLETLSFPLGKNFFIRSLAKVLSMESGAVKSLIALFNEGKTDAETTNKIESALKEIQAGWLLEFHRAIQLFSRSASMPEKVYLTSNDDISSLVCKIMQGEKFMQFGAVESEFDVVALTTKRLYDFVSLNKKSSPDAFLALQASYVDHAFPLE